MSKFQRLYVQCNPLLDISASVDDAFFVKYHVSKASAALASEEQMGIYADLEQQPNVAYVPGGSGLNTARVAQWIAQAPKGEFVSYVGCVAKDKHGDVLRDAAEKDGVHMELEYTTKAPTGTCAVCISGKERSLVANLAAANCLSAAHMQSAGVRQCLADAKLFYLTGFTLTIDVAYVVQVAEAARAAGGLFIMNLSAPFIIQFFTDNLNKVLPYVDVLFSNDDEAKVLAKTFGWDTADVLQIAQRAAAELPYNGTKERLVVFTQGVADTVYATRSNSGRVPVAPVAAEKIVDTNGAGDSFVGGFLAAYALGKDVPRCCEVGNYAAGVIIQHDGCTYPAKPDITP
ncbi:adenosine kinase [Strigomonas culicis]|uniref:Adenosine kinase n=1 Tax=Strigomonas culicis TaxID=28005 RepID=S9UVJ7_9TRYP|nr:adenosine kinase [Strigomonas culicis]EPY33213.1 adenosine kinase [Strigomonas culicis]|eukprot:EPY32804.1 adenosine kinase [Strigomonas culicis]